MPNPVQGPRIASQLRDEAELVGRVPLLADEVVVPVIDVGGDFPSHVFPVSSTGAAWGGMTFDSGVAGEHNFIWLVNPPGSGTVAWVKRLAINLEAGAAAIQQTVAFKVTGSFVLATQGQAGVADRRRQPRLIGPNQAILEVWGAGQAGVLLNPERLVTLNALANEGDRYDVETDIVLIPGTSLVAASQQPDLACSAWFQWVERPARTAELLT